MGRLKLFENILKVQQRSFLWTLQHFVRGKHHMMDKASGED